ncbi:MAG: hypothetical protein DRJ67_01015, partial [Thermoprotei archaeon]
MMTSWSMMDKIAELRDKVEAVEIKIDVLRSCVNERVFKLSQHLLDSFNKYIKDNNVRIGEGMLAITDFVFKVLVGVERQTGERAEDWLDVMYYLLASNIRTLRE